MQEFKEKKNWNSILKTLKFITNQIMNKSLSFYKLKIKITKKKLLKNEIYFLKINMNLFKNY